MDRGAWWATVCGVTKSQTQLSDLTYTHKDGEDPGKHPDVRQVLTLNIILSISPWKNELKFQI